MSKDLQLTISNKLPEIKEKAAKDKNYKTWLYWQEGNEVKSAIFTLEQAEEAYDRLNAKLSPAEFHEELGTNPHFQIMAHDVASKMNLLLNLDDIEDKSTLIELGEFYGLKLKKTQSLKNLRYKIKEVSEIDKETSQ